MQRFLLLLIFCSLASQGFSQSDYIMIGDTLQLFGDIRPYGEGKILLGDGRMIKSAFEPDGEIYQLDSISEYRRGHIIYRALDFKGSREWYVQLVAGRTNLYKRRNHYVLQSNDQMTELRRKNFRSVLVKSLLCNGKEKSIANVDYTTLAMTRVVESSNDGSCDLDYISSHKFGIIGGYSWVRMSIYESQFQHSNINGSTFSLGAFLELPMPTARPWLSFYADGLVVFPYNVYVEYEQPGQVDYFTMKYRSVVVSPGFKLTTPEGSIKPYLKIAPAISYTRGSSQDGVRVMGSDKQVASIPSQGFLQPGFSTSVGIQFPLSHGQNIHVEVKHYDAERSQRAIYEMRSRTTLLMVGFSF